MSPASLLSTHQDRPPGGKSTVPHGSRRVRRVTWPTLCVVPRSINSAAWYI